MFGLLRGTTPWEQLAANTESLQKKRHIGFSDGNRRPLEERSVQTGMAQRFVFFSEKH